MIQQTPAISPVNEQISICMTDGFRCELIRCLLVSKRSFPYLCTNFGIMASKRTIKKQLNGMTFDVVDECFSVQLYNPAKTEVTNKLVDEVLDYRDAVLAQIHQAKSKKDFPAIYNSMEEKAIYFVEQINGIQ